MRVLLLLDAERLYHPIVQFAEDNVSFSINTGYPTMTGGGLEAEMDLVKVWGLNETHLTKAVFNAARNAFMEDKKKKELQKELRKVCLCSCRIPASGKMDIINQRYLVWF